MPTPAIPTAAPLLRWFHAYANWLVAISWKRFFGLALLLLITTSILQELPPFRWSVSDSLDHGPARESAAPPTPASAASAASAAAGSEIEIRIDDHGVRIGPPGSAASSPGDAVSITLPADIERADLLRTLRHATRVRDELGGLRLRPARWGDFLRQLALLWILGSAIVKAAFKGRVRAERQAAVATETAEAESLRRQVLEARLAAMQAQVEPHFLFNTLGSIDHLIETDPARASRMQKNLIALLRASMPTLREASDGGVRGLGREIAVIRPYLEIQKMRMEERLAFEVQVPEGLMSAEFPPMMVQTLVENAIKHGLEPKAEGGSIVVKAEIVHGKLALSVADTGLGFGRAEGSAGAGVGLANIRERLQLLYGAAASLSVSENPPAGTVATVTVPYKSIAEERA